MPVVRYANRAADRRRRPTTGTTRRGSSSRVLARDREEREAGGGDALAAVREPWEPESTAYNLSLIREARAAGRRASDWADEIEQELVAAAATT